jgi:hypothetical protein
MRTKDVKAEYIHGQETNSFGEKLVVNEQSIWHLRYEALQGGEKESTIEAYQDKVFSVDHIKNITSEEENDSKYPLYKEMNELLNVNIQGDPFRRWKNAW